MRVALAQMTAGIDPSVNAAWLVDAAAAARRGGAAMLFTPEMSNCLDRDRMRAAATIVDEARDPVLSALRQAAIDEQLWIHIGSLAVRRDDGRLANRAVVLGPDGQTRAWYDKLHLFDAALGSTEQYRESASYAAGDRAVVVDTPGGRLGLSICYDLRFPDLYRALSDAGATILSIPASFTRPTGRAHWEVLLRARAIEAGAFVVAAAQTGEHADGRATHGHSLVVDPWGEVLLDMGEGTGVGFAELDPARIEAARAKVPALAHRRAIPPVEHAA